MSMDWGILLSTFGLTFIAELGDKTQLAVVAQTCKFRRPWAVFLGASLALTAVTLLGALGGELVGQLIPADLIRYASALAFIVMGALIARRAAKTRAGSALECSLDAEGEMECASIPALNRQAFLSTFGLLFLAELGDKTQLAVLSLSGKYRTPVPVFVGGALALTVVTALGAIGGQGLCRLVPERLLLWISAVAFVVMGVLMGLGIP